MKIIDINGNERNCVKAYPDKEWPGYMRVEYQSEVRKHHEWYPLDDFLKNNPTLTNLAKNAPEAAEDTLGVVTSSTRISLTDSTQTWEKDCYNDMPIWISRGKGEGQIRKVVSNTKNTITVDKPWEIIPNKSSQYVISQNVPDEETAWGNTLPDTELDALGKK